MSLLPDRILPQTEPFGRLDADGQKVIVDKNWWLFLYNLSAQVLGTGGLSLASIVAIQETEGDASDTDAVVLNQPISNLEVDSYLDLPAQIDTTALLLAQDPLLPDPVPLAQPAAAITVGGSPFTYAAPSNGEMVITGTVTSVAIVRQGTSVSTGLLVGIFPIRRADHLVVTYPAAAPTLTFLPN